MNIQAVFWSILAIAFLVAIPVVMVWSLADFLRGRGSERRGSGGLTAGVGAALKELDRLAARPSVEHQIETEQQTKEGDERSGD